MHFLSAKSVQNVNNRSMVRLQCMAARGFLGHKNKSGPLKY